MNSGPPDLGEKQRYVAVAGEVGWAGAGLQPLADSAERRYLGAASRRSQMTPTPCSEGGASFCERAATAAGSEPVRAWGDDDGDAFIHGVIGSRSESLACEGCGGGNVSGTGTGTGTGGRNRHLAVANNGRDAEI